MNEDRWWEARLSYRIRGKITHSGLISMQETANHQHRPRSGYLAGQYVVFPSDTLTSLHMFITPRIFCGEDRDVHADRKKNMWIISSSTSM